MEPDKVMPSNEEQNPEPPKLTADELIERSTDLNKLYQISLVRETAHPQFDGMGYMKYNETNEMADISYIAPKKNKYDTRVTSGITHEKDSSIVALVQSFNFETTATIFYKDQELPELSTSLTEWIRKAREIMHYDEERPRIYRNGVVQGTFFADVKHIKTMVPNKVISKNNDDYTDMNGIQWTMMGYKTLFDGPDVHMVDGKKVFLEDIHQPDILKQPGVYTVEYVPRDLVESIWGKNPRWGNVPKKTTPLGSVGVMITQGSIYSDWFYMPVDYNKCEIIQVIRPFENRYQIYINGVPMLKGGFPLTAISPSGQCHIAKGDIDTMNMFAYSKGIPAKTKMDQALYDALLRISVIMFEQQAFPPIGNNTGKLLSPDVFMPTKQTRNVRKQDIEVLTENQGMNQSTFNFINMIKEQIDNKSVTSLLENGQPQGVMTLGQYMDLQKRQLIKLGGIFDGFINFEKQVAHLILMDLLANCAKEGSKIPMKGTFEDGSEGLRVLRFKKGISATPEDSDALHEEEDKVKDLTGQDVRYSDVDPELLASIPGNPDYYIYYEVIPVDKNNDKVTQAFFIQQITQAQQLFGPQSLNVQKLKQQYAHVMGVPFDDMFLSQQDMQVAAQQQQMQGAPGTGPTALQPGQNGQPVASGISVPGQGQPAQKMFT
jgi:hypothetical protein